MKGKISYTHFYLLEQMAKKLPFQLFNTSTDNLPDLSPLPSRTDSGYDLVDHRPYQPGDSLTSINWRATARTGQLWIKRYQLEIKKNILFILDLTPGMFFGSEGYLKSSLAIESLALAGWQGIQKGYEINCLVFGSSASLNLSPASGKESFCEILAKLTSLCNRERAISTKIMRINASPYPKVPQIITYDKNTCIFIISDFIGLKNTFKSLVRSSSNKNTITALRILDPLESGHFPQKNLNIHNKEQNGLIPCARKKTQDTFNQKAKAHALDTKKWCLQNSITLLDINTKSTAFEQFCHYAKEKKDES